MIPTSSKALAAKERSVRYGVSLTLASIELRLMELDIRRVSKEFRPQALGIFRRLLAASL